MSFIFGFWFVFCVFSVGRFIVFGGFKEFVCKMGLVMVFFFRGSGASIVDIGCFFFLKRVVVVVFVFRLVRFRFGCSFYFRFYKISWFGVR